MFKYFKGIEERVFLILKMVDLEVEVEYFIGDDEDFSLKSKDKFLFNMLMRNNFVMYL